MSQLPLNAEETPPQKERKKFFGRHFRWEPGVSTIFGKVIPLSPTGLSFLIIVAALFGIAPYLSYLHPFILRAKAGSNGGAPLLQSSIQVFLPDPSSTSTEEFYQDGAVQRIGFERADHEGASLPGRLPIGYKTMTSNQSPEEIIRTMKQLYDDKEATFFVMTMSGKIAELHEHFKKWHDQCVKDGKREPVLIATVASAPGLADIKGGIVRWYIRSEEESTLLAEYMRWKMSVWHAAVFYITCHPRDTDDSYGNRGMEVFRDRFLALGGSSVEPISVTKDTAKAEVRKLLAHSRSGGLGVCVVGYGEMVKETLAELISQGFEGPIVCTSTLTASDWQPSDTSTDGRIFTVVPRLRDPQGHLKGDNRNVVYYFARNTLSRVVEITAKDPDPKAFIDRWTRGDERLPLAQDSLANGDAIVQVDVVGAEVWRK